MVLIPSALQRFEAMFSLPVSVNALCHDMCYFLLVCLPCVWFVFKYHKLSQSSGVVGR